MGDGGAQFTREESPQIREEAQLKTDCAAQDSPCSDEGAQFDVEDAQAELQFAQQNSPRAGEEAQLETDCAAQNSPRSDEGAQLEAEGAQLAACEEIEEQLARFVAALDELTGDILGDGLPHVERDRTEERAARSAPELPATREEPQGVSQPRGGDPPNIYAVIVDALKEAV